MASLDNYMIQTPADKWSLLGFLKYRKEQDDFSGIKDKEHYRYQMSLVAVHLYDKFTIVERKKAQHCLENFKNDVKEECIDRFWHNLIREKQKSELIIIENEVKISQKEKDLLVERVALQHAGLLYVTAQEAGKQSQIVQQNITNELNERKRPAEESSPIITPPPNLRSPPPTYQTEDNSFDEYNEVSAEVEDAPTETSLSNDHDESNIGIHEDDDENPFNIEKEKGSRNNKTNPKKRANYTTTKSTKKVSDTETDSEGSELDAEEEIRKLTQDEAEIRDKLLGILVEYQNKDKKSGENYMSSVCLNGILALSDKDIYKTVKKTLDMDQLDWLEKVIVKKNWKPTSEFVQYIEQFTEDACTRTEIPTIVRKSYVPGRFDPCYHEAHDIAQQILTHLSVRLEAPMRVEYKGLDLERTFAIDTIVYILNRLFRMHQDELDVAWIEQTSPDTKDHKFDGLYKVIRTTGKGQVIIIAEFSYGRKAPESKKDGDQLKLCRNAMRTLNKLLKTVPKDRARVYLVQSFNGFIEFKYLVRPIPSIYILQRFMRTKLPASFGDFEQFANDLKDLMNWQADVLSTVRAVNKSISVDNTRGDNNLHLNSVEDTPLKKKKVENRNRPSSPCPSGSPSELLPLA